MGYSERIDTVKSEIDSLITYANGVTGESDTSIGDAILTLCDGFGGGSADIQPFFETEFEFDGSTSTSTTIAYTYEGNVECNNISVAICVIEKMDAQSSNTSIKKTIALLIKNTNNAIGSIIKRFNNSVTQHGSYGLLGYYFNPNTIKVTTRYSSSYLAEAGTYTLKLYDASNYIS